MTFTLPGFGGTTKRQLRESCFDAKAANLIRGFAEKWGKRPVGKVGEFSYSVEKQVDLDPPRVELPVVVEGSSDHPTYKLVKRCGHSLWQECACVDAPIAHV